ncbi:MAG: fimbria/pilus outer membrane usher protein [Thermodesulfobacteriota bacterium]
MSLQRSVLLKFFPAILFVIAVLTAGYSYSEEVLPLKVILNSVDMGESLVVRTADGDVWITADEIERTRLKAGLGAAVEYEGEKYVSLKSIKGLQFTVNERDVSLDMTAEPGLFNEETLDLSYKRNYEVTYTRANSAFLNYGLFYDSSDDSLLLSTELGLRLGDYLGTSTFDYSRETEGSNFARLLTTVTRDDRDGLWTASAGDVTGVSGPLGTATLQGGLLFSKNFSIDPYFLQFPAVDLGGSLMTPSEVNVYVDDQLIRTERLQPGEFALKNIPSIVGYGNSRLVIKDIYGHETVVKKPFFFTDRLLKKGLHEYSYSLGFVREELGEKSFNYGKFALQALHNYGFTKGLKAGFAVEASGGLINAGPTAAFLISNYGVIDASFAVTGSEGKFGYGASFNYLFRNKTFSATLTARALTRYFTNLAVSPFDDKSSLQLGASAGVALKRLGTITAEYSFSRPYLSADITRYGLLYDRNISSWSNIFVTASRTEEEGSEDTNDIFVGFHVYLGSNTSAAVSYANNGGAVTRSASVQRNLPTGTGYGYRAQADNTSDNTDVVVEGDYQNDYGIYSATYRNIDGDQSAQLAASGGIGYIDRTAFPSRPITDSFAKVKVAGLEGVRVRYFNNEVARTDRSGSAIIPVINSYRDNKIDIEKQDIPIEYSISTVTRNINPPLRSGSVVVFDVAKVQALSGKIYTTDGGVKVPVEFSVMKVILKDRTLEGLVGSDGEFYIENVPAGEYGGTVFYNGAECRFDLNVPESSEVLVEAGEVTCAVE